mmetsp:Transcript_41574/g.111580  ORF Transcript_41574/g.111580 Transcript_41574/m.111580 type:complete len:299 (-) Transcript_41574:1012-1908(-)
MQLRGLALLHIERSFDDHAHKLQLVRDHGQLPRHLVDQEGLALRVKLKSDWHELVDDLLRRLVFLDGAAGVEEPHVARGDARAKVEDLLDPLPLGLRQLVRRHREHEVHRILGVVLAHLRDGGALLRPGLRQLLHEPLLVVLCPPPHGQLGDLEPHSATLHGHAHGLELPRGVARGRDGALEATVERHHGLQGFLAQSPPNVRDDVARIEVGHSGAPARPNAIRAVHQHQRDDWSVRARLDLKTLLLLQFEDGVVLLGEEAAGRLGQARKNVARRGVILSALQAGPEHPARHKKVYVV